MCLNWFDSNMNANKISKWGLTFIAYFIGLKYVSKYYLRKLVMMNLWLENLAKITHFV